MGQGLSVDPKHMPADARRHLQAEHGAGQGIVKMPLIIEGTLLVEQQPLYPRLFPAGLDKQLYLDPSVPGPLRQQKLSNQMLLVICWRRSRPKVWVASAA